MAKTKKRIFDGLYAQLEETDGSVVLFSAKGEPSVIFSMTNPVQQLCTDAEQYMLFQDVLSNIVQTLGEGYALQKQDILCKQAYRHDVPEDAEFLTRSYFKYFEGREFTEITTYLIITQEAQRGQFVQYDPKKWLDFHAKVSKVSDILAEKGIRHKKLTKAEVSEYCHRFMAFQFRHGPFSMTNFKASDEYLKTGERVIRSYPLVDIDEINLPSVIQPYTKIGINGYGIATDLLSFLTSVPHTDCVVFNQVVQIPNQRKLLRKLQAKAKRHGSMPDPSNKIAKADIEEVLNRLAVDTSMLVNTNFNILMSCPADKVTPVTSYLETKLYECGIMPSRTAYNQLELFVDSFPGNAYSFNPDYDLFLTLSDAALCFFFKEHLKGSETTPLTTYYTDRQGLPVCIDITGKEGKVKMTDNANFFCIGPSGSGKSFHMNSVVRQLLEQNTDVVMVDTGDSYEGICGYFGGTYISYSKEKPISMNPFKVTREEYDLNFGEKKNFLKSLIFLIFKGNELPSKIEDMLVNQTIVEYYDAYFHPFEKFTDIERDGLRQKLLVAAKMDDEYEKYAHEMEGIDEQIQQPPAKEETKALMLPSEERRLRLIRQCRAFQAVVLDKAATDSEKEKAAAKIELYKKELYETSMLVKIDKQIDHMEEQKRRLKVKELSFNSYYEFALERIPQITSLEKIKFDIRDFAAILKQFYRGGELEMTLNSDLDVNLFDERFIVFEIDKIKDDPVLFPIVVLIIMDVFLQKMRIKKGRKALIIEEAWKAIASPTMAEYIKYLYKTVRKFHGIAGVVTQELNDVIDSPIVKEAIINNSDVKILLDQTKFKDRYEDIAAILGLTPIQRQQIFTINALNNHDNRNYFKEVWICRGQNSDVYGVEEPPECYWAYTTERAEKEALKIYLRHYGTMQDAITHIEIDRKKAGISKYLDFARQVNNRQKVMSLW
ncbi:TraG family conjugative transposon ATPase [Paramuribaculum intestinale]|uniref:TraG family conjugative transposon ATPase n=4 Tax=Muribaculaceae TaxID=2005473 RepID=A0A2V1IVG9_9BACT|nr:MULTISPECIES: TraG family conjugative transposon ATPase [Muribaculaceae]MBJ2185975.1 TraG family conjugative transposon ATPase [Muribaculaceae bacterium]ROS90707.1 TraG family conjugative transposon ATPase [Muribaculaceae bacterium Isolate-043 (Harlan)]MCX4277714.1 TraG family conjugative transposon ATPase [Muribaculum sp.]PWB06941.1 TraG family conjugative transposon ATPase [Paramuribaculum intestinale]PWB07528.1 TraG family conjugative transposon ATPase [Paramuribaculum intestinale]